MDKYPTYIHKPDVHNLRSPEIVVPILVDNFKPNSVLDVGCGIGTWLNVFQKHGVKNITGIDGDFVNREQLNEFIDEQNFVPADLNKPFDLDKRFDLVISLEVAEHLLEASADDFINSLCIHSETVVFSAAIPGQGGQNHINEQWPAYWRNKFSENGFKMYDMIRPIIWNNKDVDWWYKQNIFVFSRNSLPVEENNIGPENIVHPELFKAKLDYLIQMQEYINELEVKLYSN